MTMSVYIGIGLLLLEISQISAISKEEQDRMTRAMHAKCVKKTGVSEQLITDCTSGIFAEDEKLKCYMKCLLTSALVISRTTGEWNLKILESFIPDECREKFIPVIYECGVVKGVDDCDTAFQTNKCWQSKAPERYQLL